MPTPQASFVPPTPLPGPWYRRLLASLLDFLVFWNRRPSSTPAPPQPTALGHPSLELVEPSGDPPGRISDPIAAIQARLRRFPQARVTATADLVTVLPLDPAGFTVTFQALAGRYLVTCDGWHEEFELQAVALNCFTLALSPEGRLKVTSGGEFAYRWEFQVIRGGRWCGTTEVGLLFFPSWRRRTVVYLQNRLLTAA